jgi:hypothetical protein
MTPEEALDLLPLLAASELDETTGAEVRATLAGRSGVGEELAKWTELDGLLERALASERPAAAAGAEPPHTAVRCPYCRDSIAAGERVLCGGCLTPHHRVCFAENEGCSLLGCEETRTVGPNQPASVLCGSCKGDAPAGAAWCPWCRSPIAPARPPRHARRLSPRLQPLLAFAASVLLLLPGSLGVGYFTQRELERTWWEAKGSLDALEDDAEARQILGSIAAAQKLYRARATRGGEYASDLEALSPLLEQDEAWRSARRGRFTIATEASLSRPDERFFASVTRGTRGVFTNEHGRIQHLTRGLMVDRLRCALVASRPGRDPRDEERETLELALADVKERWASEQPASERARRFEAEARRLRERVERLERGTQPKGDSK